MPFQDMVCTACQAPRLPRAATFLSTIWETLSNGNAAGAAAGLAVGLAAGLAAGSVVCCCASAAEPAARNSSAQKRVLCSAMVDIIPSLLSGLGCVIVDPALLIRQQGPDLQACILIG